MAEVHRAANAELRDGLTGALAAAQDSGELAAGLDPRAVVRLLLEGA
ncbi:hypothetical protein AB0I81_45235 [Nonomuraea sp. NPDC050404]